MMGSECLTGMWQLEQCSARGTGPWLLLLLKKLIVALWNAGGPRSGTKGEGTLSLVQDTYAYTHLYPHSFMDHA